MATGKRYYWIKLRDNFFEDDSPADYLMSQPDGANFVVLYQMLCLKTINTDGKLSNKIGEILIPYDVEKIRRTCKYFSADTIRVAMNLYGRLGLIYEDRKGVLTIADFKNMVGSETDWAVKKARQRVRSAPRPLLPGMDAGGDANGDNVGDNVPPPEDANGDAGMAVDGDIDGDAGGDIVPIEIRDKEIKRVESKTLGEINKTPKRNIRHSTERSDFMATDRVQAQKDKISRLEAQIRNAQVRLAETRKALAREELLQLKEQIDTLNMPFDELMTLLRQLAEKGEPDHEQGTR